jgi:flagellar motor protein MotB
MIVRVGLLASLALAVVVTGTGCQDTKATSERGALLSQNEQLKKDLDAANRARQEADARANMAAQAPTPTPDSATPPSMEGGAMDLSSGGPGISPAPRTGRTTPASADNGFNARTNGAGEVVIELPGDVLFDSGKATIKATAKKTLDSVASRLKSQYGSQTIRIEGHTDASPVKKAAWDDNWDLGAARANAVRAYLSEKGVQHMYIASFAATDPKSSKNQALNRRVDIVVVRNASSSAR